MHFTRHVLAVSTYTAVLGVYLATSQSQSADVECFASASSTQPLDSSLASCEYSVESVLTSSDLKSLKQSILTSTMQCIGS